MNSSSSPRNQSQSNNNSPKAQSSTYTLAFVITITVLLLLFLLFIIIFLCILKCPRKKPRKIQRQGVIVRKHLGQTTYDPDSTLLEPYPGGTINNIRALAGMLITDRTPEQKPTDASSDTERPSTTNNLLNERNDTDDLSDLDLTNIPFRNVERLNKNLFNTSSFKMTKYSQDSSPENLYITEFKERAAASKQHHNLRISSGSKTSTESRL